MAVDFGSLIQAFYPPGAGRIYVDAVSGNDANSGVTGSPKRTIGAALAAMPGAGIVWVRDGDYFDVNISGRNHAAAGWLHVIAESTGARIRSNGGRAVALSSSSYVGVCGFEIIGIDDPAHTSSDCVGSTGNVHHIAIWRNHCHDGSHGVAVAGNLGPANNVDVSYNLVHDCGKYLPSAASGISLFEFWNTIGSSAGDAYGYANYVVGNVCYYNHNVAASSDGNGIIIDDMQNTQSYGGPTGKPYTGRWLVAGNLCVNNGGRGVHAFFSNNVDEYFNTVAHNMWAQPDLNQAELSEQFSAGSSMKWNLAKVNTTPGRTKWLDDYASTLATDANVFLAGVAQGSGSRNRSSEGLNYFANNSPSMLPANASLIGQWRPDGGSGAVEAVVLDQGVYDKLARWPDYFGDYRPARAAGWAIGFTEAVASTPVAPTATFAVVTAEAYVGQPVAFRDTSVGAPTSWLWEFGDGATSTAQHPTHTYAEPFNFTATLTATNAQGSSTTTGIVVVHDPGTGITLQAEDAVVTSGYPSVDANALHIITDYPGFEGTGYAGHFGQTAEKLTWSLAAPNGPGSYAVSWRYKALEAGVTRAVFVNGVSAGIVQLPTNIAAWSDPWGTTPTIAVPLIAGTNTIELRHVGATYTKYCDIDSMSVATAGVVQPAPAAAFDYAPLTVYAGQPVQFHDLSTGDPTAWAWRFGDEPPVSVVLGALIRIENNDTLAAAGTVSGGAVGPSGQAMPVGNLTGWRQIYAQDFNTPSAVGTWGPQLHNVPAAYAAALSVYEDGWPDTAGKSPSQGGSGAPSRYMPTQVLSTSNGMLIKRLFNAGQGARSAALVVGGDQLYGRYTIRFRSDPVVGFKTAWLLWPASGVWPRDGEIDFPEGNLDSTIQGFMHRQGATAGGDQDFAGTAVTYAAWHTATIEWKPSSLKFVLDGVTVGSWTSRVPNTAMHWVVQTESELGALSNQPPVGTAGNLYIDWLAMYAYDLSIP